LQRFLRAARLRGISAKFLYKMRPANCFKQIQQALLFVVCEIIRIASRCQGQFETFLKIVRDRFNWLRLEISLRSGNMGIPMPLGWYKNAEQLFS
jgi:hypothetical protein